MDKIVIVNPKYEALAKQIEQLPDEFDSVGRTLYRGRNEVKEIKLGNTTLIVKRYQKPNILKQLQYRFAKTGKAKKAYEFAQIFHDLGLNTPDGVAYILIKDGKKVVDSYFVSTVCPGRPLNEVLNPAAPSPNLIDDLAGELAMGHIHGLMFGDLNLSNIFSEKVSPHHSKIYFIDINRSRKYPHPLSKRQCAKNMMRLSYDEPLLWAIAETYAKKQNWDGPEFAQMCIDEINAFKRKKVTLGLLKGKHITYDQYLKLEK